MNKATTQDKVRTFVVKWEKHSHMSYNINNSSGTCIRVTSLTMFVGK